MNHVVGFDRLSIQTKILHAINNSNISFCRHAFLHEFEDIAQSALPQSELQLMQQDLKIRLVPYVPVSNKSPSVHKQAISALYIYKYKSLKAKKSII